MRDGGCLHRCMDGQVRTRTTNSPYSALTTFMHPPLPLLAERMAFTAWNHKYPATCSEKQNSTREIQTHSHQAVPKAFLTSSTACLALQNLCGRRTHNLFQINKITLGTAKSDSPSNIPSSIGGGKWPHSAQVGAKSWRSPHFTLS